MKQPANASAMPTLFTMQPRFDGRTFDPALDQDRLSKQLGGVFEVMRDGKWRSLDQIAAVAGGTTQSVSARLGDLRKRKFGAYSVHRRRVADGVFEYQSAGAPQLAGGDER